MGQEPVWILLFFALPALILSLTAKSVFLDSIGAVVICYAAGILLGNSGLLPEGIGAVQDLVTTVAVPLALPLIFFSLDIRGWRRQTRVTLRAFSGALIAITIASLILFLIFRERLGDSAWQTGGMLVGVYTGGSINLAAIGAALGTDSTLYVALNAADVVVGGVYLLLVLSLLPPLMRRILPSGSEHRPERQKSGNVGSDTRVRDSFSPYFIGFGREHMLPMLKGFGLSLLIFGSGGGLSLIVPEAWSALTAILVITTLGIGASFLTPVRRLPLTFPLGHYFLLVFSFAVSSMANLRELSSAAPLLLLYITLLLLLSLVIHTLISRFLKVDADTHLIVTTALVYSPPFVPVVAASLRSRDAVLPGMAAGIAGWVLGNYIGIGFGYLLRVFQ